MKFDQRLINLLAFLNGEDAVVAVLGFFFFLLLLFRPFSSLTF